MRTAMPYCSGRTNRKSNFLSKAVQTEGQYCCNGSNQILLIKQQLTERQFGKGVILKQSTTGLAFSILDLAQNRLS